MEFYGQVRDSNWTDEAVDFGIPHTSWKIQVHSSTKIGILILHVHNAQQKEFLFFHRKILWFNMILLEPV